MLYSQEEEKRDLVFCKELWTVISGTHIQATEEVVSHELQRARPQLIKGLIYYKHKFHITDNKLRLLVPPNTCQFILSLRLFMGLDALQSWKIMTHYLMFEYKGTDAELKDSYEDPVKFICLMKDIWLFYRRDRLFLLKCTNLIVTYAEDGDHPHKESFSKFVASLRKRNWFESMMSQLERMSYAHYPTKQYYGQYITHEHQLRWEFCNLREQIELLHNLIVYMFADVQTPSTFHMLLSIASDSKFGRQEEFKAVDYDRHAAFIKMISYLHNILLLQCLNFSSFPRGARVFTDSEIFFLLDPMVEKLGNELDHAPIRMAWTTIKVIGDLGNDSDSEEISLYEKLGNQALDSGAFEYLEMILRQHMFQETSSVISTKAFQVVYDIVFVFTCNFKKEQLCEIDGLLNIIGPLLLHPKMVENFWLSHDTLPEHTGPYVLYEILSSRFPVHFIPLIELADSLAINSTPEQLEKLRKMVFQLKTFTEVLNPAEFASELLLSPAGPITSSKSRNPVKMPNFCIPENTTGYYLDVDSYLFIWEIDFSIADAIIAEFNLFVLELYEDEPQLGKDLIKKVTVSLSFIKNMLISTKKIWKEMVPLYLRVVYLTHKVIPSLHTPSKIFSLCIDIIMLLVPFFPREMESQIKAMCIFPDLQRSLPPVITSNFEGVHYNSEAIGRFVLNQETVSGHYPLLISYLTYLYKLIQPEIEVGETLDENTTKYYEVILPGVMFIITEIFPYYYDWKYNNARDIYLVAYMCLKVFHELLYVNGLKHEENATVEQPKQILRRLVLNGLLNMRAGHELLRITASGDAVMQTIMEREFNWISGQGMMGIHLVHHSLSVLNRVLLLKFLVMDKEVHSFLEDELFCAPDKKDSLKVIPTVAHYIDNVFSPELTTMAVKLLTRIALDYPKILIPCLGLEGELILDLVFKRLNSKLISNSHKVALLNLITASVDNQPGMCEALFNLPQFEGGKVVKRKRNLKFGLHGGVLVFACAVLDKAAQEPIVFMSTVYAAVVDLICTIWLSQSCALIDYLRKREHFWTTLCAPFLAKPSIYVYPFAQILNILVLEIYEFRENVNPELLNFLHIFLNEEDATHFKDWSEFVTFMLTNDIPTLMDSSVPVESWPAPSIFTKTGDELEPVHVPPMTLEEQPDNVQLLLSWKRFITVSLRRLSSSISTQQKIFLSRDLMKALQFTLNSASSTPVLHIVELYLLLTSDWHEEPCDDTHVFNFQNVLTSMASCYAVIPLRMREAFLGFGLKSVKYLSSKINEGGASTQLLVEAVCKIVIAEMSTIKSPDEAIALEMEDFRNKNLPGYDRKLLCLLLPGLRLKPDSYSTDRDPMSSILSVDLLQNVLKLLAENHASWLKLNVSLSQATTALLTAFGTLLEIMKTFDMIPYFFNLAVAILHLVILLVNSKVECSSFGCLLSENVWLQVIPSLTICPTQWLGTRWTEIYRLTLRLNILYLRSIEHNFLNEAFKFALMHSDYLRASILSLQYSLAPDIINLNIEVLDFFSLLAQYTSEWLMDYREPLGCIVGSVMACIHIVAAFLVSPSTLKDVLDRCCCYHLKRNPKSRPQSPEDSTQQMTSIHNQLLVVVSRCLAILQNFIPRVHEFINSYPEVGLNSVLTIEMNFMPPVLLNFNPCPALSFASLLTLVNVCQQSLNKGDRLSMGPNASGSAVHSDLSSSLVLKTDRELTRLVLEMTAELITVQGMLHLFTNLLDDSEIMHFRRKLHTEMTAFLQYVRRSMFCYLTSTKLDMQMSSIRTYMDELTENASRAGFPPSYSRGPMDPNEIYLDFSTGPRRIPPKKSSNKPPVYRNVLTTKCDLNIVRSGKDSSMKTTPIKASQSEPRMFKPHSLYTDRPSSSTSSRSSESTLQNEYESYSLESVDISDTYLFLIAKIFHEIFQMF